MHRGTDPHFDGGLRRFSRAAGYVGQVEHCLVRSTKRQLNQIQEWLHSRISSTKTSLRDQILHRIWQQQVAELAPHHSVGLRPFSFVEVCNPESFCPVVTAHSISFDQLPREAQVTSGRLTSRSPFIVFKPVQVGSVGCLEYSNGEFFR